MTTAETERPLDFVRSMVADDLAAGRNGRRVITRFPPEPNGYLHIGHAKAISIDFGLPQEFGGQASEARCHLRFDDTNPTKEEQRYIDAIKEDIRWLGFEWEEHEYHAADYFETLFAWAKALITGGYAYVDDQTAEQMRQTRGTLTRPGVESPFRRRSIEENLDLFERMKAGEFQNGARVLRAKIDMASANLNMRDPVMYRILHAAHPRTGDTWCVYPMYDWAHGQSDWIEGITHSLCTLEFEAHRPLYDWFIDRLIEVGATPQGIDYRPRQTEFARLNLTYVMMSKRKLLELVNEGHVSGWDDPRMPTLSGMRRRGYTPEAIRDLCARVGVTKYNSRTDFALLENCVRDHLNRTSPRRMAVLRPLRVVIENYPEGQSEDLEAINNPEDESAGARKVPFSRWLYIERDDFLEEPPKKFFRLAPGREVRLRYAYLITCTGVVKDAAGEIVEIRCTYDPATRGGDAPDGRRVKATLHWVSAAHAVKAEVRLYDHLFRTEDPEDAPEGETFRVNLNRDSLEVIPDARLEPSLADAAAGDRFQFERLGYFCVDPDSSPGGGVFNRTATLKDTWAKVKERSTP
jgi:glutaminyl-tRNA synthetase